MPGAGALMRKEQRGDGEEAIRRLVSLLADELEITAELEDAVGRARVKLTPAAYLMLLVPIFEGHQLQRRRAKRRVEYKSRQFDPLRASEATLLRSIKTLARGARDNPAAADQVDEPDFFDSREPTRSSFSVIKAFWENFCNIPPFCGEA